MLKKLTITSFILSFLLLVTSISLIPFVAKLEFTNLLGVFENHYMDDSFTHPVETQTNVIFKSNERVQLDIYRSPTATEVTVHANGFFIPLIDFSFQNIDDSIVIKKTNKSSAEDLTMQLLSSLFYQPEIIAIVVPESMGISAIGPVSLYDLTDSESSIMVTTPIDDEFSSSESVLDAEDTHIEVPDEAPTESPYEASTASLPYEAPIVPQYEEPIASPDEAPFTFMNTQKIPNLYKTSY